MVKKYGTTEFTMLRCLGTVPDTVLWSSRCKQPFQRRNSKYQQEDRIGHQPRLVKGPVRDGTWHDGNGQSIEHKTPPRIAPAAEKDHHETSHCQNEGSKKHCSARTFNM